MSSPTIPTPQDSRLLLQDTVTKTGSFNSVALDLGSGYAPGGPGQRVSAIVAVVTRDVAIVFGIGDGIFVVGDAVTTIDPGPDNAPPYIAYGLVREPIEPVVHFVGRASEVHVLAVATDGLSGIDHASLVTLAADPRYAHNASLLRKRLIVLSDAGRFSDDATVGVIQRRATAAPPGAS